MSDDNTATPIHTRIWQEEAEPDNPFATRAAYCHGYDVYGEMLGNTRWVEMLYLLLRGQAPSPVQANVLEALAIALANPGPRDASVHAAMCGGVGGSPAASSLMAALAVGAGQYTGAREVFLLLQAWEQCGTELVRWRAWFAALKQPRAASVWPTLEHAPGFDPHGVSTPTIVCQTLAHLAGGFPNQRLAWLASERETLEAAGNGTLAMTCVAAAALADLGFTPKQGEMLYLLLRLPGAAAHALEQGDYGLKKFPFFAIDLQDDPADKRVPIETNT